MDEDRTYSYFACTSLWQNVDGSKWGHCHAFFRHCTETDQWQQFVRGREWDNVTEETARAHRLENIKHPHHVCRAE